MRKMIRLIMFICLASAVTNLYAGPSEKKFEGEWVSHKDVDFGIHLHQDGNQLTGYHSAVTKDGRRTDTAVDGEGAPSIAGTIKGDTAIVDVQTITFRTRRLYLKNITWIRRKALSACVSITLPASYKRESRHCVSGCRTLRSRLQY
jgi:hypothetical protein